MNGYDPPQNHQHLVRPSTDCNHQRTVDRWWIVQRVPSKEVRHDVVGYDLQLKVSLVMDNGLEFDSIGMILRGKVVFEWEEYGLAVGDESM